jgi:hypothetical protein
MKMQTMFASNTNKEIVSWSLGSHSGNYEGYHAGLHDVTSQMIVLRVRVCMTYRRVLDWMIGFIYAVYIQLRVFENRVLSRIFEPKRDEVTGDWRKLHNDELHNLYSSPSIIRMIK